MSYTICIMVYLIIHLISGFIAAGALLAYAQNSFPSIARENYREDLAFSIGIGFMFGPIALLAAVFTTGFLKYGWSFKKKKGGSMSAINFTLIVVLLVWCLGLTLELIHREEKKPPARRKAPNTLTGRFKSLEDYLKVEFLQPPKKHRRKK